AEIIRIASARLQIITVIGGPCEKMAKAPHQPKAQAKAFPLQVMPPGTGPKWQDAANIYKVTEFGTSPGYCQIIMARSTVKVSQSNTSGSVKTSPAIVEITACIKAIYTT